VLVLNEMVLVLVIEKNESSLRALRLRLRLRARARLIARSTKRGQGSAEKSFRAPNSTGPCSLPFLAKKSRRCPPPLGPKQGHSGFHNSFVLVLNEMVLVLVIEKKSPRWGRFDYDYDYEHD
jgi:hypothetical protein